MRRKPQAENMVRPAKVWQMPVVNMLNAPVVKPTATPSRLLATPTILS